MRRAISVFVALTLLIFGTPASAERPSKMIVFGDSISDTGNVFLLSGGVIAAPPYFEGRASNGPVAVEQAAKRLGLPPLAASLLGGNNYAYFGAATGGVSLAGTPSLGEQVGFFFADGKLLDGDELIVVQGGGNDAFGFVATGGLLGNDPATAAANIAANIAVLASAGGEVFVVPNLGKSGQIPLIQLQFPDAAPLLDDWTFAFNIFLDVALDGLEATFGITIVRIDQGELFNEMVSQPKKFGFKNSTEPACPDCGTGTPLPGAESSIVRQPNKYVFWDFVHPTERAHEILGKDVSKSVKEQLGLDDD